MLCALEGCSKKKIAEPCGLENTHDHDAVMHVHKLVVSNPNKRAQTRGYPSQKFKTYVPAMADFIIWA